MNPAATVLVVDHLHEQAGVILRDLNGDVTGALPVVTTKHATRVRTAFLLYSNRRFGELLAQLFLAAVDVVQAHLHTLDAILIHQPAFRLVFMVDPDDATFIVTGGVVVVDAHLQ